MLKTIIVLPDGREISSGTHAMQAVQSMTFTEMVNDSQELSLGSACSNMVEVTLITPGGSLPISAGDELAVYKEDEAGIRYKLGLFTTEKPTRPSANTMRITAFDRVSWLDKDLTLWLAGLTGWPYRLIDFARMVCEACNLSLYNDAIPNGEHLVQPFSADGITGRKLIQWVGQIAGRFCRATPEGEIEFAWYEPVAGFDIGKTDSKIDCVHELSYENGTLSVTLDGVTVTDGEEGASLEGRILSVTDDGEGAVCVTAADAMQTLFYYMNGLGFEDYMVKPIEKVQLRQNEEDVGTVYPDRAEECNTYTITGNYLLTATAAEDLEIVVEALYRQLKDVTYTPCKVTVPANMHIRAGHIIPITDSNGRKLTVYVMRRTQSGQRDTLECTGSYIRASSAAVNNQTFKAYMGKVLNLRADVDGLKAENKNAAGDIAQFKVDLEGISTQVVKQKGETEGLKKSITQVTQDAESLSLQVKTIREDGTKKLKTGKGYTFDDEGLTISDEGGQISNLLDHTGMYVKRGGEILLKANNDGVEAIDVTVRNYLRVGPFARFEDYTDGADSRRTACFFT